MQNNPAGPFRQQNAKRIAAAEAKAAEQAARDALVAAQLQSAYGADDAADPAAGAGAAEAEVAAAAAAAALKLADDRAFQPAEAYDGSRTGYVFFMGGDGLGYYPDPCYIPPQQEQPGTA